MDEVILPIEEGWRVSKVVGSISGLTYYRIVCACGCTTLQGAWKAMLMNDSPVRCEGCEKLVPECLVGFVQMCASSCGLGGGS